MNINSVFGEQIIPILLNAHDRSYLKPIPPILEAPVPRAVLSKENAIKIIRVLLRRA
jgi:hypothetical protein